MTDNIYSKFVGNKNPSIINIISDDISLSSTDLQQKEYYIYMIIVRGERPKKRYRYRTKAKEYNIKFIDTDDTIANGGIVTNNDFIRAITTVIKKDISPDIYHIMSIIVSKKLYDPENEDECGMVMQLLFHDEGLEMLKALEDCVNRIKLTFI